jgi:hypothetical protein
MESSSDTNENRTRDLPACSAVPQPAVRIKVYETMVQPAVVCASETWAVAEMDMKELGRPIWERKILGRIVEQRQSKECG